MPVTQKVPSAHTVAPRMDSVPASPTLENATVPSVAMDTSTTPPARVCQIFIQSNFFKTIISSKIPWLLMPWLLVPPKCQQPWYWISRICRPFSFMRQDFSYLCCFSVWGMVENANILLHLKKWIWYKVVNPLRPCNVKRRHELVQYWVR